MKVQDLLEDKNAHDTAFAKLIKILTSAGIKGKKHIIDLSAGKAREYVVTGGIDSADENAKKLEAAGYQVANSYGAFDLWVHEDHDFMIQGERGYSFRVAPELAGRGVRYGSAGTVLSQRDTDEQTKK